MVAVSAVLMGILLGLLSGGKLERLSRLHIPYSGVLLGLFVLQGVARGRIGTAATSLGVLLWFASSMALIGGIGVAVYRSAESERWVATGLGLVAVGTMLNILVVALNGAMPVLGTGERFQAAVRSSAGFYVAVRDGALMVQLADVLQLPLGQTSLFVSAGDVVLWVGAAVVLATGALGASGEPYR